MAFEYKLKRRWVKTSLISDYCDTEIISFIYLNKTFKRTLKSLYNVCLNFWGGKVFDGILFQKGTSKAPSGVWCGGGPTWRWEFNCAPPRPHFSSSTPPAHFPNLSGHALPPAPPLSGAQLMLRTVDKNLEAFFAPKKNFMPPPFPLMWSQTHAKVWGQSHCLVAPWLLLDLLIFFTSCGPTPCRLNRAMPKLIWFFPQGLPICFNASIFK